MDTSVSKAPTVIKPKVSLNTNVLAQLIRRMNWKEECDNYHSDLITLGIEYIQNPHNHDLTPEDMYRYIKRLETIKAVIQTKAAHTICCAECNEIADFFKEQRVF